MKRRPLILVDADDVLSDIKSLLKDLHSHINGGSFDLDDITDYDLAKCVMTAKEDGRIWAHLNETPELISGLTLIDGAQDGLAALRALGRVVCVTAPPTKAVYWMGERMAWLQSRCKFNASDIVHARDKTLIPADMIVDDNVATCMAWDKLHTNGNAIVFTAPHNRDKPIGTCLRANGWPEVVRIARELVGV